MVPAALCRLLGPKDLFDAGAQRFGSVNHKQVLAIGGQTVVA
jgi:hypothetical protein